MPDAAERSEIEKRLGSSEARYRALVEHIPAVTYIDAVDEVSSAVYMSPQVESMLGYAPEEWLVDAGFFLKILHPVDRAIVEGLGYDRSNSAIVSATITLAQALGLEVIVEGVETEAEAAELRSLGCEFGQDYYWWAPQPARELSALLESASVRGWRP
jgi:PAS domain S-box-containing protein